MFDSSLFVVENVFCVVFHATFLEFYREEEGEEEEQTSK